jgi:hypothetical protein
MTIGLSTRQASLNLLAGAHQPVELRIEYFFTAETVYQDVVINGKESGTLKYTYFPKEKAKNISPEMMVRQAPAWAVNDLLTKEAALDEKEMRELVSLIARAGFMDLMDAYGGAGEWQRYYPYTMSVKVGDRQRKVLYQDFPEASPRPKAFSVVEEKVLDLVRVKFGDVDL